MKGKIVKSVKMVFKNGNDYEASTETGLDKGEVVDWVERVFKLELAEPLIKDEKIRKAVRAWAEANSIKEIIIFDCGNNAPYTPVGAVEFAGNASRLKILFRTEERFDTNRIYTIEELCGDE